MFRWFVAVLLIAGLIGLALTTGWWLDPLLAYAGANADVIQGLTGLAQLGLWVLAAVVGLGGWVVGRRQASALQQGNAAAKTPVITGDIYGTVNVQVVADEIWQAMGQPRPAPNLREASQAYLQHLIDRYRYLDFKGMGIADRIALRLELIDMYVPLKARIEMPEGETWSRHLRLAGRQAGPDEIAAIGQRLSEPQPVLDLLQRHNGLIILGDPGAGKTTFLKYVTLQLALGQGPTLGIGQRLPVLLPLSAYANDLIERNVPLDRFIARYYQERGIALPLRDLLSEALARGGALLLLDGLDEVKNLTQRRVVVERVLDFFTTQQRHGNKFILTSRIVGYRDVRPTTDGLAECTLVDFEPADMADFIGKWTTALERAAQGHTAVAQADAEAERQGLQEAVERNPGVQALAANPLLLTILALMKRQGVTLPERRVELYQKYIEALLKTWNQARSLGRSAGRDLDVVETIRLLAPLALWMHQTSPGVGLVKREPLRRELEKICAERGLPQPEQAARQLLDDVREHAGLLLERGAGEYGFIHLTFQEYLAAVAIAQRDQRDVAGIVETLGRHVDDDNWHEVTMLTIGYIGIIQQLDQVAGEVVRRLIKQSPGQPGAAIVLAGQAVVDAMPGGVDQTTSRFVQTALAKALAADRQVAPLLRVQAGVALARLGDERPGVGRQPDGLPDIAWCDIPAGPFTMGSDPKTDPNAFDDEKPQHTITLPGYKISRYPITNAQFAAFSEAGGYQQADYWPEAQAQGFWQSGQVQNVIYYLDEDKNLQKRQEGWRSKPHDFGEPFNLTNHPVVGVSWYEALAFCRWLEQQIVNSKWQIVAGQSSAEQQQWRDIQSAIGNHKSKITLPSEAEWEKAARGVDGRRYPWGSEVDPNQANYEETKIGTTSTIGCFPGGASPYGVEEMSGNVWEWTRSLWGEDLSNAGFKYPYAATDGREDLAAGTSVPRVLRGGAFNYDERDVRCAVRLGDYPDLRNLSLGFRVVVSPLL